MPETLIPIVAIIGGGRGRRTSPSARSSGPLPARDDRDGPRPASALIYRNKREQGTGLRAHAPTLERDLVFFLIFFALGVAVGAVDLPEALQIR